MMPQTSLPSHLLFLPPISRASTHSSKRSLCVFLLPCMPRTCSICQSSRQAAPSNPPSAPLWALEAETANDVDWKLRAASEAGGSNADDPSWLELVPWRDKQLATGIGAAVWVSSNEVMFQPQKRQRRARGRKSPIFIQWRYTSRSLYAITLQYIEDVTNGFYNSKKGTLKFSKNNNKLLEAALWGRYDIRAGLAGYLAGRVRIESICGL